MKLCATAPTSALAAWVHCEFSMSLLAGVHLLPSTGEFTYDPVAHDGQRSGAAWDPLNTFYAPGGLKTDYSYAIDQLQTNHPECQTVSVVCAWFANSLDAANCQIYPSTTYTGGSFRQTGGALDSWRVSSLTQASPGLIQIPPSGAGYVYGGTPSDASIVRCIRDLKSRGYRVVFYPFLLMTASGFPWRGRITHSPDLSSAAAAAVQAFLGSATPLQFTPDATNLTVAYAGTAIDYTYRRMILHYAWLMTVAGGVNLFVIGSELRGLETTRGPGWTPAGTTDVHGFATWDYPFVAGLQTLANDVRAIFDSQALTKGSASLVNLITYSADWSSWMGFQHPSANGQWPHLDSLWASPDIDLVAFDNYLPLSDWTTGAGGLDVVNWRMPKPIGAWPPSLSASGGLGLASPPTIHSLAYLKANIEAGEKFNWYYADGASGGVGLDPLGSDQYVSLPLGDRATQSRNAFAANQQILANKQMRWWWNNTHQAVYASSGGWAGQGPVTPWAAQSKPICFLEYGFPACDKGTNQPNVFFDAKSLESATPYWSVWRSDTTGASAPIRDDALNALALQAIYEYCNTDGNNELSWAGVPLLQFAFCCAWNWDVRPFPIFPRLSSQWGDAGNWATGTWLNGRGPAALVSLQATAPDPAIVSTFPILPAVNWAIRIRPRFASDVADHVSGRSTRRPRFASALYDVELTYDSLSSKLADYELQTIAGFFEQMSGAATPFWFSPLGLAGLRAEHFGVGDGATTTFPVSRSYGAYTEVVLGVSDMTAVYLAGIVQPTSAWTLTSGYAPTIVFAQPPPTGAPITADFSALWLCRFAEDASDFEEFMAMLFELKTFKLKTVRS